MSARPSRDAVALCGILGAPLLVLSFVINPAPPANLDPAQLRAFAVQHHDLIVIGGWLQGMASLLLVLFAIGLVHLAGAAHQLAGWITLLAGAVILMVSLTEITFYPGAAQAVENGDLTSGIVSNALIKAVQHVFLIAPAMLLPVGFVLLGSGVLPRVFAYLALAIGAALQVLGFLGLFGMLQPVIDNILIIQALWFVAAEVAVLVGRNQSCSVISHAA